MDEEKMVVHVGVMGIPKDKEHRMNELKIRLEKFGFMKVHILSTSDMQQPVEEWPPCHTILTIHSRNTPKDKILQYIQLHKPQFLNDMDSEWKIRCDRTYVSQVLRANGINVARYVDFILDKGGVVLVNVIHI